MGRKATRSIDLPVPREALAELGLTKAQIKEAEKSAPKVLACQASEAPDAWFDVDRVAKALRALAEFRHTKGRWAGRRIRLGEGLDPWQIVWVIAPVFGWVRYDEEADRVVRVIRTAWVEIPRKNGKSTISSAIANVLLLADGEAGAEVYAAAGSIAQAGRVFEDARRMCLTSTAARKRVTPLKELLRVDRTGGIFRALSRVAETAHGLNVSGGVIDEIHTLRQRRALVEAIESGTGARDQPLIVFITTADEDETGTIYDEKHTFTVSVAQRSVTGEAAWSHYGVVWAADKDDDPFAEETWLKANPGTRAGSSPTLAYLRKEAAKAQVTPSYLPSFLRLHLNVRGKSENRWANLDLWDDPAAIDLVEESKLKGLTAYGGLDLASTQDFTAWALLFSGDQFDDGRWRALVRLWIPESSVERRKVMGRLIRTWAKGGWVTITDGDVVDYDAIASQIDRDLTDFDVVETGYDKWNAPPFLQPFTEAGMVAWPVPQSIVGLSRPTKELERWLGRREFVHGGNPALRWMATNVVSRSDSNKNIRFDKDKSLESIDGMAAIVNALAAVVREREAGQEVLDGALMA